MDLRENMKVLSRRGFLRLAAAAVILPAAARFAVAQNYPARPVRLIVPFPPGGPTDVCARLIAQKLSERLGRQFFIENVGGASGNIGTGQAAKATADGYTLLVPVNSHVINPMLFESVPYKVSDFEPVVLAAGFASALSVHPSVSAKSVRELVELVRASPGKFSYASAGLGTPSHLLGEQFRLTLGLDLVHVPYAGSGPATAAAVAGHTPITVSAIASVEPQVKDNRLRALAVFSIRHARSLPELPTMAEAGYPDLDGDGWIGVMVPARTPAPIVTLLNREILDIIALPEMQERLATLGLEPLGTTPEGFADQLKIEAEKWGKVIRAANLRVK
jgi:tripartite-type tricarboxylate transporter receptor subunit TctC